MKKEQAFLIGAVLMLSLVGCSNNAKPVSLTDDSDIKAQSEAVITTEDNNKEIENVGIEETTKQEINNTKNSSISHPLMVLEYEGEKFDMINDTLKDWVYFIQKMGITSSSNSTLDMGIGPYGTVRFSSSNNWGEIAAYNPYDKEILIKDTKIGGKNYNGNTIDFNSDAPTNIKFLNGNITSQSSMEDWLEAFKEYAETVWDSDVYWDARRMAEEKGEEYNGPEPFFDSYENVIEYGTNNNEWYIEYRFRLEDGRDVKIGVRHSGENIEFTFDPYYE